MVRLVYNFLVDRRAKELSQSDICVSKTGGVIDHASRHDQLLEQDQARNRGRVKTRTSGN